MSSDLHNNIDALLAEIRERRIILQDTGRNVKIWAPNTPVSRATRAAIAQHRKELLHMLRRSNIATCPNSDLHRKYWSWSLGEWKCDRCFHLLSETETK